MGVERGGSSLAVPRPKRKEERRNGSGPLSSPVRTGVGRDGCSPKKAEKEGEKGTGRKWGKSRCILQYPPRRLCKKKKEKN